ncbi:MAG: UvrD-helicase domain-containing protein, partial [Parasporobacterium sp.]|nr:UvrD-helicase domain-containing protein [Parasporobacterium sp.]
MAGFDWTEPQLQAIESYGTNILVSAAAGSGKTAVLVERVIRAITRETSPMDIDRLLVMTFTRAAASSMKNKIYKALRDRLAADPGNRRLRQQLMRVQTARISTIDSLCMDIVRDNIHAVDLDPGFRIADEAETGMLRKDILEEIIEEEYRTNAAFRDFAEYYTDKNDSDLESIILKLFTFSESHPEPEAWLRACV